MFLGHRHGRPASRRCRFNSCPRGVKKRKLHKALKAERARFINLDTVATMLRLQLDKSQTEARSLQDVLHRTRQDLKTSREEQEARHRAHLEVATREHAVDLAERDRRISNFATEVGRLRDEIARLRDEREAPA